VTSPLLWGAVAAVLSWYGTRRWLKRGAGRRAVAVPNERSSHTLPTPTGGGLQFAPAMVMSLVIAGSAGAEGVFVPAIAALIAMFCGLVDDIRHLRPLVKMGVMTTVGLFLAFVTPLSSLALPHVGTITFGVFAIPITLFWLAGFTNAFNFMDGIDGIATLTAIVSAATYALAGVISGDATLALVGTVTAGASLGFLPWNFPKARIFMGDAGSLPLGLLLAYCAVLAHVSGALPFPASVLLLGPFVFDSSFTLLRRAARGERVWQAHREHIYQRLSRIWDSHPKVSLLYAGFSIVTGALALAYRHLGAGAQLLSLGLPLAAMLAFAASVLVADRRREAQTAASTDGTEPSP